MGEVRGIQSALTVQTARFAALLRDRSARQRPGRGTGRQSGVICRFTRRPAVLDDVGRQNVATKYTEEQVHQHLFQQGLESVIDDTPAFDAESVGEPVATTESAPRDETEAAYDGVEFELWRIVKAKALEKLGRLHRTIRYGEFIGSKIKLPIDSTRPMELDLLGQHEDGLFILELKVDRSAERNAFSELYAYSNYIAGMFALSGHKDIANVLVANLDVKITRQAFLYDLLITDRTLSCTRSSEPAAEATRSNRRRFPPLHESAPVARRHVMRRRLVPRHGRMDR